MTKKSRISKNNPVLNKSEDGAYMTPDGEPVEIRVSTVQEARKIHQDNWQDDSESRKARAIVQGMDDGKPPWNQHELDDMGMGGCSNIDFGDASEVIEKGMEPYIQCHISSPYPLNIVTEFGSDSDRASYGRIISEEWGRMLTKKWRGYFQKYLFNVKYFRTHGVSYCYWNDRIDLRWDVSTAGESVVPRMTKADADEFSVISTLVEYSPKELYDFIKGCKKGQQWSDEDRKEGWNSDMVKRVIIGASEKALKTDDWEAFQRSWKGNDFTTSSTQKTCRCVIMRVTELDGSVTQLIFPEEEVKDTMEKKRGKKCEEDFLYKETNYFTSMDQSIVPFMKGVGSNGYLHSVRGVGSKLFPVLQSQCMLKNKFLDAINIELSVPISGTEEALTSGLAFNQYGPFMIIPEGIKILSERKQPNYSQGAIPALNLLDQDKRSKSGEMFQQAQDQADAFGSEQLSSMSMMESALFFTSQEVLLREALRRTLNILDMSEAVPSGKLAFSFKRRCMKRGVPPEALAGIDLESCTVYRPIGNGSASARRAAQTAIMQSSENFDEEGRRHAVRDFLGSLPGVTLDQVNRYAPPVPDLRPGIETSQAINENNFLLNGMQAMVLPDQNHFIHLEQHTEPMAQIIEAAKMGRVGLDEAATKTYPLYQHCIEHMQMVKESENSSSKLSTIRKALHDFGEIIENGFKQAAKKKQDAEEEAAMAQQEQMQQGQPQQAQAPQEFPNQPTPAQYKQLLQSQTWLWEFRHDQRRREEIHQAKMASITEKSRHDRKLSDIKNSAAIIAQMNKR